MGGRGGGAPGNAGRSSEPVLWRESVPPVEDQSSYPPRRPIDRDNPQAAAVEQAILQIVGQDWQRLPSVRDALSKRGFTVSQQDAGLYRAALNPRVRTIPIANLKSLSLDDRRAAIHMGGEWQHAIMVER